MLINLVRDSVLKCFCHTCSVHSAIAGRWVPGPLGGAAPGFFELRIRTRGSFSHLGYFEGVFWSVAPWGGGPQGPSRPCLRGGAPHGAGGGELCVLEQSIRRAGRSVGRKNQCLLRPAAGLLQASGGRPRGADLAGSARRGVALLGTCGFTRYSNGGSLWSTWQLSRGQG